uniref:Uncharacterized protein n=1 Tax=Rhizophora mucronata TaxID=61149 RepID=A0A2P2NAD9_RHIMU
MWDFMSHVPKLLSLFCSKVMTAASEC